MGIYRCNKCGNMAEHDYQQGMADIACQKCSQEPGAWHYYAHLNKFASVRLYERVKEGQVIGYVGKTGNAKTTPAHLHYGVYLPSGAINPYPLINQDK